jgi:hypothetical protein
VSNQHSAEFHDRAEVTIAFSCLKVSDGVDHGLGVCGDATHDLVGDAEPAQILEHEDEVVCRLVEGGKVRTRRRQRVGEADLLVEAHLAQVELEVLTDFRPYPGVEHWKLHDHRGRHVRATLEMGPVQAAEQPNTNADLLEPAFPNVSPQHLAEPCRRHRRGISREHRHPPHPPRG